MYNRIRSEIYRATHSISTWLIILAFIVSVCFASYLMCASIDPESDMYVMFNSEQTPTSAEDGLSVSFNPEAAPESTFPDFAEDGTYYLDNVISITSEKAIFLLVFTALFCGSIYSSGFVKSIPASRKSRIQQLTALFAVVTLWFLLVSLVGIVFNIIVSGIYYDKIGIYSLTSVLGILGRNFLLHMGLTSFIIMTCVILKKKTAPLVIGVIIASGSLSPFWNFADWIFAKICKAMDIKTTILLQDYSLMENIYNIAPYDNITRNLVVGAVSLVLFLGISYYTICKKDIV